jgi:hypothetical protein
MVGVTTSSGYIGSTDLVLAKTSSVDAAYSDPDLLIREYFLSSSAQRARSRSAIAQHIKEVITVFDILNCGASGKARDGFDGAANLLAEISDLEIFISACKDIEIFYAEMCVSPSTKVFSERFLEILIKAIACAYKINANQRFSLLTQLLDLVKNRITAASLVDALVIISDELNVDLVRKVLEEFTIPGSDQYIDQYICAYALEALQDIE